MQLFAWLESNCLPGGDVDLGTGSGISTDAGLASPDAKDAESSQFDALACGQSLFETLEDRIHRRLCLGPWESRSLDYVMDDVLFNQRSNLAGST
jgi:hypothetical protein